MNRLSVVIPSRLETDRRHGAQGLFLERAIRSILAQPLDANLDVEILVGVDAGAQIPRHWPASGCASSPQPDARRRPR